MKAAARLLGHPVHQMLIVLPMGLFAGSIIFDVMCRVTSSSRWADVAFWTLGAGIVSGLIAAVFGAADWVSIPPSTRAKRVGLVHGMGNVLMVALFAVSFAMRVHAPTQMAPAGAFILSLLAGAIALGTGWLGGELVNRLGVGVHEDANLDAPSSLSDRPAREGGFTSKAVPGRNVNETDEISLGGARPASPSDTSDRPTFGERREVPPSERSAAGY